jgi:hypothetical protein
MSGMTKSEIMRHFRENLIVFVDALVEKFPQEYDLHLLRLVIEDAPIEPIIVDFGQIIIPYADMVMSRNDIFFLEKCSTLLKGIVPDTVELDHFKRIWLSSDFSPDDRNQLWRWFRLFLNLAQKYIE